MIQAGFDTLGVFLGLSGGGFFGGGGSLLASNGSSQLVPAVISQGQILGGVAIPISQSVYSIVAGAGGLGSNIGVDDVHTNKPKHCLSDLAPTWTEQKKLLVDAVAQVISSSNFPGNAHTVGSRNGRTMYQVVTQIQNHQGNLVTAEIRFRQHPGGNYEIGTAFVPKDLCSAP